MATTMAPATLRENGYANERVMNQAWADLSRDPKLGTGEVFERVKDLDPQVKKMDLRQFHARVLLPIKKELNTATASGSAAGNGAAKSAPVKATAPGTKTASTTQAKTATPAAAAKPAVKPAAKPAAATGKQTAAVPAPVVAEARELNLDGVHDVLSRAFLRAQGEARSTREMIRWLDANLDTLTLELKAQLCD